MPKPSLTKKAVDTAKKVVGVLVPQLPVDAVKDVVIAEAAINFAWEQAQILQMRVDEEKKRAIEQGIQIPNEEA